MQPPEATTPTALRLETPKISKYRPRVSSPEARQREGAKAFVLYKVSLMDGDDEVHTVRRRFSDFRPVIRSVLERCKVAKRRPVSQPRQHAVLKSRLNKEWIEYRRVQLQAFLDDVFENGDLAEVPEVQNLLGFDDYAAAYLRRNMEQRDDHWRTCRDSVRKTLSAHDDKAKRDFEVLRTNAQYCNVDVSLLHLRNILSRLRGWRKQEWEDNELTILPGPLRELFASLTAIHKEVAERDIFNLILPEVQQRGKEYAAQQALVRSFAISHAKADKPPLKAFPEELKKEIDKRDEMRTTFMRCVTEFTAAVEAAETRDWVHKLRDELFPSLIREVASLRGSWPDVPLWDGRQDCPGDVLFGTFPQRDPPPSSPNLSLGVRCPPGKSNDELLKDAASTLEAVRTYCKTEVELLLERRRETEGSCAAALSAIEVASRKALLEDGALEGSEDADVAPPMAKVESMADAETLFLFRMLERAQEALPQLFTDCATALLQAVRREVAEGERVLQLEGLFREEARGIAEAIEAAHRVDLVELGKLEEATEELKESLFERSMQFKRQRQLRRETPDRVTHEDVEQSKTALQESIMAEFRQRQTLLVLSESLPEVLLLYPQLCNSASSVPRYAIEFFDIKSKRKTGGHVFCVAGFAGRTYGVKEVNLFDGPSRAVFKKESDVLGGIRHPNVIAVEGVLSDDEEMQGYVVFPHFDKGNLAQWLNTSPPYELRLSACSQVLSGLLYLHESGIVHGGVKLENVLVRDADDGGVHAVIADFDVAVANRERLPRDSIDTEVPSCIPPECDGVTPATEASDMYSLGLVLLLALHCRLIVLEDGSVDLSEVEDEKLKDLLKSLLKHDPDKRLRCHEVIQHDFFRSAQGSDTGRRQEVVKALKELHMAEMSTEEVEWTHIVLEAEAIRRQSREHAVRVAEVGKEAAAILQRKEDVMLADVLERVSLTEELDGFVARWETLEKEYLDLDTGKEKLGRLIVDCKNRADKLWTEGVELWAAVQRAITREKLVLPPHAGGHRLASSSKMVSIDPSLLSPLLPPHMEVLEALKMEAPTKLLDYQQYKEALRLTRGGEGIERVHVATDLLDDEEVLDWPLDHRLNEKLLFLPLPVQAHPVDGLTCFARVSEVGCGLHWDEKVGSGGEVGDEKVFLLACVTLGRVYCTGEYDGLTTLPARGTGVAYLTNPHSFPPVTSCDAVIGLHQGSGSDSSTGRTIVTPISLPCCYAKYYVRCKVASQPPPPSPPTSPKEEEKEATAEGDEGVIADLH